MLKTDDVLFNYHRDCDEKIGKLYVLRGNKTEEVKELHAGDIGALAKLSQSQTTDSLSVRNNPVAYLRTNFSKPYVSMRYKAKNKGDVDKISQSLQKILMEDQTLRVVNDSENRQTLLYGMGEQQLEIVQSMLLEKYKVEIELMRPKVAFRETIRGKSDVEYKYKKQSGGHGQYGHVKMKFEPSGDLEVPYVFEALVRKNLDMQQTDKSKKQQKRIPQITTRLEQIDKVLNKLYEDNALGAIPQDRYEQMSQKYSEEYYTLKAELAELKEQLSAFEDAGGWAHKFLKLIERYAAFTDLTPAILNEFISRIEVHERDKKRAKQAVQHIGIYFSYIGKFENELTQLAEPTEEEIRQMREKIEEAQKEKSRAYHRNYSKEYRAKNLEKRREYERIKAREYRAKRKAQAAALPVS